MSGTTPELNLGTAVDSDDTADYLTVTLANSLRTVDALFSNVSGHNHNGAHQGGALTFTTLNADQITFSNGSNIKAGTGSPTAMAITADNLGLSGNLVVSGTQAVSGNTVLGGSLVVAGTSGFNGHIDVNNTLTVGGSTHLASTLIVDGATSIGGLLTLTGGISVNGNSVWTSADFGVAVANTANAVVKRDGSGAIVDPKTSGQVTLGGGSVTLPAVASSVGLWRYVKAWGAPMVINLASGTLILANTAYPSGSYTLAQGDSLSLWCDGASWWVL